MDFHKIINDKELQDIPIMYILRVIHAIQKELINDRSSSSRKTILDEYKSNKE